MVRSDEEHKAGQARELVAALKAYLQARARGLAVDHDDLVQQTLADLYQTEQQKHPGQPLPVHALHTALAILRRRVADRYRELSRDVVLQHSAQFDLSVLVGVDDDSALVLSQQRRLRRALNFIARLDGRDRRLLMEQIQIFGSRRARTPAERKQLSRLRARLRAEIEHVPFNPDDEAEGKA